MERQALKRSSLSIDKIQKSIGNFSKNITKTKSTALKLNRSIVKSSLFKRASISEQKKLFTLRRNNERRKLREDVIEAGKGLGGVIKKTGSVIADSTKGFFSRILNYVGLTVLGWLIRNLPNILGMTKTLIERVQNLFSILNSWKNGLLMKLTGYSDLLSAVISNIRRFDFTDQSGQISDAMEKIEKGGQKMEEDFDKMVEIFKNPIEYFFPSKLEEEEEEKPEQKQTEEVQVEDSTQSPGDLSGTGTVEQQALLETIRFAEGTTGPTGYSMFFGDEYGEAKYGDLTDKSVAEVEKLVTKFLKDPQSKFTDASGKENRSAAVGAYQFVDITELAKSVNMSIDRKFDKKFQDELALKLAEKRGGVDVEKLKREGLSDDVIKKLSPIWSSFPGNIYGQPTKRIEDLKSRYERSEEARSNVAATITNPRQNLGNFTRIRDEINVSGPSGGTPSVGLSGGGGNYGASRDDGMRMHQGIDIGTSGQRGWYVGARINGTVTYAGTMGGYGKLVIIKDGTKEYWFAHLEKINVKNGEKYTYERTIGEIGNSGNSPDIHLHFEVREGGKDIDPNSFLSILAIGRELVNVETEISKLTSTPQITPISKDNNIESETVKPKKEKITPTSEITPVSTIASKITTIIKETEIGKATSAPEITPISKSDNVVSKITTPRKGSTIAMMMPSPSDDSEPMMPPPSKSSTTSINIRESGTDFIKKSLLNELAYT